MRQQHLAPLRVCSFRRNSYSLKLLKKKNQNTQTSVMSLKGFSGWDLNPGLKASFFVNQDKLVDWAIQCCCSRSGSNGRQLTFCIGIGVDYSGHRLIVLCGSIICDEDQVCLFEVPPWAIPFHSLLHTLNILLSPS